MAGAEIAAFLQCKR
nr:hypothetical protein [Escherichia coli]